MAARVPASLGGRLFERTPEGLLEVARAIAPLEVTLDIVADLSRASIVPREADIAIRQHPQGKLPAEPSALASRVGTLGLAAYASPAYVERHGGPRRPATDLQGHAMISTGAWAPGNEWNDQREHPATYVLSVYPFAAARAAALAGIGVAVLPCLEADGDPRLVRLTEVIASHDMWLATSPEARNNPPVLRVKHALLEMLRVAAPELRGGG